MRMSNATSETASILSDGDSVESAGGNRTFSYLDPNTASLNVQMGGRQIMADGTSIRTWYFGDGFNGDRTVPSPVIEAIEGETVQVTLSSDMPHSIHFHGLDVDQANDGVPSTSGYVARMGGGGMMNFGRVRGYTNLGSPFTYVFTAPHAGTYAYHCHVDTVLHFEMGMYGTVIIRPPDGSTDLAWIDGSVFDKEYIWHLHTFDSSWHSGMGGMGGMASGPGTVRHRPMGGIPGHGHRSRSRTEGVDSLK
jgi:plastocyanin